MMAEKAALFGDDAARSQILAAPGPKTAKTLGRKVRGFVEATWHRHRFEIVIRASRAKFGQNPELGEFLQQTGIWFWSRQAPLIEFGASGCPEPTIEGTIQTYGVDSTFWGSR